MVRYTKTDGLFFAEFSNKVFVTDGSDILVDNSCRGLGEIEVDEVEFDAITNGINLNITEKRLILQSYVDEWTLEQMSSGLSQKVHKLKGKKKA